jgi:hypothetical protein
MLEDVGGAVRRRVLAARAARTGLPPPYRPADPWLLTAYVSGLTAAALAAMAIHWFDPPPAIRMVLALTTAALFVAVGFPLVRASAGRSRRHERVLRDARDRATFEAASADVNRILLAWPDLAVMATRKPRGAPDPPEPGDTAETGDTGDTGETAAEPRETLERALWRLTLALAERGALRTTSLRLRSSLREVLGRATVYAGVTDRAARVAGQLSELEIEIDRRTAQLHRLAALCQRPDAERADDHTEAVLAAYGELVASLEAR